MTHKLIKTDNYLLVVDDNKDIEENMWTVKDGKVREVSYLGQDNGYAIIAHLPLNGSPILEGVDLLPPYSRHQEDGIDKKSFEFVRYIGGTEAQRLAYQDGYIDAREKYNNKLKEIIMQFDLEIKKHLLKYSIEHSIHGKMCDGINEIRSNILQSLHQYPTEFECEMVDFTVTKEVDYSITYSEHEPKPKTIITAQGVQWVGKYK